jgi:tetratricopeptide (TPR) repeat protein
MIAGLSQAADAPAASDGAALAWRLDGISSVLLGPTQPAPAWRRSTALLEAAGRLDPTQPRFPRLRELALHHLGDTDGAIAAMRAYRALVPADRVAQAQLIDLYASRLETIDAKVAYLDGLLDKQDVPAEVRSHAAAEAAGLLMQKSREQAAEMARRAVAIYPLPRATSLYYELAGRDLPLKERVAALVEVLKSSPLQSNYLQEMARLLAENGLAEESLPWYGMALGVIMRSGPTRPPEFHNLLIDYAAEQVIAGHASTADTLLGQMLDELPLDPDAWFVKLSIGQNAPGQIAFGQTLELAKSALTRRWNSLHDEILNGPAATQPAASTPAESAQPPSTEPTVTQPLDPAPVIEKLKSGNDEEKKKAVFFVLEDLAWFELYYDKQPEAAKKWIDTLAEIPVDPSVLGRLRGWLALRSGQPQQAIEIFNKIADRDPLAELGLLRSAEEQKQPPNQQAAMKLLDDHRVGLVGAILWSALRSERTQPTTRPAAGELTPELAKFPRQFLDLLDSRAVRRLYDLRAEPVTANVAFGDPILMQVTVTNYADVDITIGADALLRPDLWFDAQILGLNQQMFRGVTYDQLGGALALHPRESAAQTVRLDGSQLYAALHELPGSGTRLTGDVVTNPVVLSGGVMPGPAGTSGGFGRSVLYSGLLLNQPSGKKQMETLLGLIVRGRQAAGAGRAGGVCPRGGRRGSVGRAEEAGGGFSSDDREIAV